MSFSYDEKSSQEDLRTPVLVPRSSILTDHPLKNWKSSMSSEDYDYLITFLENAKSNLPNNKLIVIQEPDETKSNIIFHIANYMGNENCTMCNAYGDAFHQPITKLVYIDSIDDYQYLFVQQLKNVLQYGQSVMANTTKPYKINKSLLDCIKFVKLEKSVQI